MGVSVHWLGGQKVADDYAKRCEVYSYSARRAVPCSKTGSKKFQHLYALSPVLTVAR